MKNSENFIEFILPDNYKHQLDIWQKANNISREKTELFHDFIISLYELISETYMGSDVMGDEDDQKKHFNWCWDKLINNFNQEKIFFKERGNHYEYFLNLFLEAFYYVKLNNEEDKIRKYFVILFDFSYIKTRSELDMMMEIYKLLEQNLKK